MRKTIFTLLICLLFVVGQAQNVTITGQTNKANELVRLFVYKDLINEHGEQLSECQSDAKGNFLLSGKLSQTLSARIFVGLESVDMVLTPNATYNIEIIVPEQQDNVSYFDKEMPTIRVMHATDKGLYRQIIISDDITNGYLIDHINQIYRGRQVRYIDSIQATINRELPKIESDYVKNYNLYRQASIRLAISADGGKKIVNDYFDGKPILYTNTAYIDLFKELFSNQFNKTIYDIHELDEAFFNGPKTLKDYLATDPFMAHNPCLAELITIYNLQGLCNADSETRRFAKAHLEQMKANTQYAEHKSIITDFFAHLNRLAPGTPAPDFNLKDSQGNSVKLSDFKDGLVLLQFMEGFSPVSERQMTDLNGLHAQWRDSVQIVTIATRDKMDFYKKQFADKGYDWPLLDLGNNILLLEAYNVKTFPEYILIGKGNKMAAAPAPTPDRGLEERVRSAYKK